MLFRARDLLVRQRTQAINALRGHLAEFGVIAPQGPGHVVRLASAVADPCSGLSEAVRKLGGILLAHITVLKEEIQELVRRLLITGAMSVVRCAVRRAAPPGSWLARMLSRKPRMLVAVALANKIARIAWALMRNRQVSREPAPTA